MESSRGFERKNIQPQKVHKLVLNKVKQKICSWNNINFSDVIGLQRLAFICFFLPSLPSTTPPHYPPPPHPSPSSTYLFASVCLRVSPFYPTADNPFLFILFSVFISRFSFCPRFVLFYFFSFSPYFWPVSYVSYVAAAKKRLLSTRSEVMFYDSLALRPTLPHHAAPVTGLRWNINTQSV